MKVKKKVVLLFLALGFFIWSISFTTVSAEELVPSSEHKSVTGTFGTSKWTWDDETSTVYFKGGVFPETSVDYNIGTDPELKAIAEDIKQIIFTQQVLLDKNSEGLFYGLEELEKVTGAELLNTSNVSNMSYMFMANFNLEFVNVSQWDLSNTTTIESMFQETWNLKTIDVSLWDTSKIENMNTVFFDARGLEVLDVSNWDTHSVLEIHDMFSNAVSLTNLDVSNWDTSKVINMEGMFAETLSLNKIELGKDSIFLDKTGMPEIVDDVYTGQWTNGEQIYSSSDEFMKKYDGKSPGTYYRLSK